MSFFNISFKGTWKSAVDPTGAYLIDRSPEYFEPILNFLRNGLLIINEGVNRRGVLEEARFFGLSVLVSELENEIQTLSREECCITRKQFVRLLMTTSNTERLRCQGLNLPGVDLSYLDLSCINFKHANLTGANLKGATLAGCVLNQANLSNACLDVSKTKHIPHSLFIWTFPNRTPFHACFLNIRNYLFFICYY